MKILNFFSKYQKIALNISSKLGFVTLGKLMSFITVPIIATAIGPEGYGLYNFVVTLGSYGMILANWGFLAKGIRDIAKYENKEIDIVNTIVSSRIILWGIGSIVLFIISFFYWGSSLKLLYILIVIFTNIFLALFIDYYYYGKKNTATPSLAHFLGQLIFLIIVFFFVKDQDDLIVVFLATLLLSFTEFVYLFFRYPNRNEFKLKLSLKTSLKLIKENFYLGFGAKASFLQNSIPILIIPYFLSAYHLGIYSSGYKIFLILSLLLQTFNLVFAPWVVKSATARKKKRLKFFIKIFSGYLFSGLSFSFLLFASSDLVVNVLFGDEFEATGEVIRNFAIFLVPIWSIYMCLTSFMNNYEIDKSFFYGTLFQTILTCLLSFILISNFGLFGAILGLSFSTLFVSILYGIKLSRFIINVPI
jgi:PST family polysaccharide transporter